MKKLFSYMMVCGAMMTAVLGFTSCEDDLDVQQAYPFTVETMPVPKRLVQGETAEIRCEIVREGYFSDTRYTIRYFQPDGEGTLRMDDGMVLLPNDRYPHAGAVDDGGGLLRRGDFGDGKDFTIGDADIAAEENFHPFIHGHNGDVGN